MTAQPKSFNRPAYHQQFEVLCLELLIKEYGYLQTTLYGRNGQKQNGIDLISTPKGRFIGAQCKHTETLSRKTINEIWRDSIIFYKWAKSITNKELHYVIFTSCKRDAKIQDIIIKFNENNLTPGMQVSIKFWNDIEIEINKNDHIKTWYNGSEELFTPRKTIGLIAFERKSHFFSGSNMHLLKDKKECVLHINYKDEYPKNTILITDDSLLNAVDTIFKRVMKRFTLKFNGNDIYISHTNNRNFDYITRRLYKSPKNPNGIYRYSMNGLPILNPHEALHFTELNDALIYLNYLNIKN